MVLRAQTNNLSAALQQGLFEEEANRNLDAAISNYQSLVAQFDQDRQVAATAIFRLGECYRKLGRTNDAAVQYQRIVRDFSDQHTLATLSRQNLTGLGVVSQPRFQQRLEAIIKKNPQDSIAPATSESAAKTAELEAESAVLKTQIAHLSGLNREARRSAIQQNFPNPVLTTLVQQLNETEQNLASLTNDYAPTDLHVARETSLLKTINQQIDDQVDGVIKGLQAKMAADIETAEILRAQTGSTPSARAESSPTTDNEDQEIQHIQQMLQNSPDLINAPDGSGHTPLEKAAINGWIKVAAFLLDHGADVNAGRGSALNQAANAGNRAMVEFLLSRGADINAKAWEGKTPLHTAAEEGFQAVTEVLLANKADVNALNRGGVTPLFLAASAGREKIVQMLLAAGAKVNLKDDKGRTVLDYAMRNSPEIFQALLDAGTNPNTEDSSGRTPLSYAAERDNPKVVKLLLAAKADPNGGKLDAPLLCAIHKPDLASAEFLLQAGANPNAKTMADWPVSFGGSFHPQGAAMTPLFLAVSMQQLPMVNLLLKFKADPNDSQTDERPLLFSALSSPDILGALLDAGGKADSHLTDGTTLLDYALNVNDSTATVDTLLQHGANPNARDTHGNTPLHYAVWGVLDRNKVALLLEHHADPNVRNDEGRTPLDYIKAGLTQSPAPANETSLNEIADLLRQHGALDNLPHWDRIEVSRPAANYSATVFRKGTNDWNRFTLLETLLNFYPGKSPSPGSYSATSLPLPDLSRLTIIRHKPKNTNETRIQVNLLNATNGIDGSRDVPLEFGDVVEIPEREHALGDRPIGLTDNQHDAMVNCLKGSVRLLVRGGEVELPVYPYPEGSLIGSVLKRPEAQGILLSSSDLSRVKVTRHDPVTGKRREWVVNCAPSLEAIPAGAGSTFAQRLQAITECSRNNEQSSAAPDLLLRDGDVIEVPEK